ncbi:MAG TPA: sialidase family protein [Thermoanaerobaculia bacterium]|nr:sialidase family protein [Thermoanaerobaculia bacterium]
MGRPVFSPRAADALALLLMACVSAMPARAGVDSWTPFGPGQGRMVSVAASSRGDLFAVTAFGDLAEIWQLPAGTATWRWRNNGLGRPAVTAFAVHPTQPDSLWAATGGPTAAIFHSTDAGATWLRVAAGPADFPISQLRVMPLRNSVVLFAQRGGVSAPVLLRSADGGVTWSAVTDAWGPVAPAIDHRGLVYASAVGFPGLVRSTDGGQTFRPVQIGVRLIEQLRALHVTRGRSPLVFASFSSGLYRSTNGVRFERVGFSNEPPSAVASDPRDSRRIYVTTDLGLYSSSRLGRAGSFRSEASFFYAPFPTPTALIVPPVGPLFLSEGDLRGSGLGSISERGIAGFGASEMRIAEADPTAIAVREYTQCAPQCDLRTLLSYDGGFSFIRRGIQVLPHSFVDARDFAFDPASSRRWLELSAGVVLVDAAGLHLLSPTVVNTTPTAVEIGAAGALLVGAGGGVLVSRDDGASWATTLGNPGPFGPSTVIDLRADVGAPDGVLALVVEPRIVDPPTPAKLLAFRSVNAAAHWSPVLPAVEGLLDVEPVPGSPTTLFALFAVAGGSELRRSDDGGVTSVPVHTFTTAEAVADFALDAVAPDVLYAASATGVLRSRDGGATWESTPGTLDAWGAYRQRLQHVWVHPSEPGHVFAAPADGGLFENRLSD